jgi:aminoglycoside phosphotransferase (APT) family kinase protein
VRRPSAQSAGRFGSSNALFRLGDELLVRLPRPPGGSATIEKDARWLPQLRPLLPVSAPEIVAVGEPDLGCPERWSIVRWITSQVPPVIDLAAP